MPRCSNPQSQIGSRTRSVGARAVFGAAGIAALAVAAMVLLAWRSSRDPDRGTSQVVSSGPGTHREPAAGSPGAGGSTPAEGLAEKFQADLYGLVEPLVQKLPDIPLAHCLLASVHRRFARSEEASRELQQALALDPACTEAHYLLGMIALDAADYGGAEKHLQSALEIDPQWADVPLQLANAQVSQGRFREAVSTLDTYLKQHPADAEAWCQMGQAYQRLGDSDNAKRCHLTALELAPDFIQAHYGVATALRASGAVEDARQYSERIREMRSSMTADVRANRAALMDEDFIRAAIADVATKAGAIYAMQGHLAEAVRCWTRAAEADPTHVGCREMLCRLTPTDPKQWFSLGNLYIQSGRPEEAELPFQRVIELVPQRAIGYAALAEVYIRLDKEPEKAVQLARTAVELESTAYNHFVLAAACERVEDWAGAESALTRAIEIAPEESPYREALARLQEARPQ